MPIATGPLYTDSTTSASGNPIDETRYKGQPADPSVLSPELSAKQVEYQTFLEQRITYAQEARDRQWPEFSDKTYLEQYQNNEKIANTYLEKKKNDEDVQIATGTIESKLNTLLSHIDNLNLAPEIRAFDKDDVPLRELGTAFTDIFDRLAEHDGGIDGGDMEKRLLRQKDLMKQGTVFVQDKWCTKSKAQKTLKRKFDGKFNFDAWDTAWKPYYTGPDRVLLYGPNVYLGDITQFSMDDQPYVFTLETMSYDTAKSMFGKFEMWKFVKPGMPPSPVMTASGTVGGRTIYDGKFRMTTLKETQVEVIKYQDPTRDEFQIQVNGIMLLPIGFPLSAVTPGGKINIAKQVLYPINPQFAYGKSFVSSGDVYELSKILDEMISLFVMKTRKSITPPYLNLSGKIISRRVLAAGSISQGIPAGALQPIGQEGQGVTQGEFAVYKELLTRIESSTIGPGFQGQYAGSNTTATEVLEVQRQAKLALGIIISACTMLEVKLGYLRLPLVIANYFEPIDEISGEDGTRKKKYRETSRETDIDGAGTGTRRIIPTDDELPTKEEVRQLEIMDENEYGYPSQRIYISPKALRAIQVRWQVIVVPKERNSSAYEKLLFRETIADAIALYNLGAIPNIDGLQTQLAKVYEVDRNSLFGEASEMQQPMMPEMPGSPGAGGMTPGAGSAAPAPGMTAQVGTV